LGHTIS
jgi:hypothetical protein